VILYTKHQFDRENESCVTFVQIDWPRLAELRSSGSASAHASAAPWPSVFGRGVSEVHEATTFRLYNSLSYTVESFLPHVWRLFFTSNKMDEMVSVLCTLCLSLLPSRDDEHF